MKKLLGAVGFIAFMLLLGFTGKCENGGSIGMYIAQATACLLVMLGSMWAAHALDRR